MKKYLSLNPICFGSLSSILHVVAVPVFALLFVLVYNPLIIVQHLEMGSGGCALYLLPIVLILMLTLAVSRLCLYLLRNVILPASWVYVIWCIVELLVASILTAVFILVAKGSERSFFDVARITIGCVYSICVYPYIFIYSALCSYADHCDSKQKAEADNSSLIRFYDEYHKLKFIISASSIIYIKSEDNYVQIFHKENRSVRHQMLRSSMSSLSEPLSQKGIVRCHRSYFVNPAYIAMLRKEPAGNLVATLTEDGCEPIPVSRKWQASLTELL